MQLELPVTGLDDIIEDGEPLWNLDDFTDDEAEVTLHTAPAAPEQEPDVTPMGRALSYPPSQFQQCAREQFLAMAMKDLRTACSNILALTTYVDAVSDHVHAIGTCGKELGELTLIITSDLTVQDFFDH